MSYKVRDLITDALLEIGANDPVDPLEPEDLATGMRFVQLMMDSQNADRFLLYTEQRIPFVLTPNQGTNTIGPGGQFDTTASLGANGPRPIWIGPSTVTPAGDVIDYPLIPYDREADYDLEPLKTVTDPFPRRFWYQRDWPLGLLKWWPQPTTNATVNLALAIPLVTPATPDTVLSAPPGYQEFWKLSLAKRLCRPYRRQVPADLVEDLRIARGLVVRQNDPGPPAIRTDGGAGAHYNILNNRYTT